MTLKYYDSSDASNLVEDYFSITYSDKVIPLKTNIIPLSYPGIVYIYSGDQYTVQEDIKKNLKGLTIFGQFDKPYPLMVNSIGFTCGFGLKPTTLFKLINIDISKQLNKHSSFTTLHAKLAKSLNTIFLEHKDNPENLFKEVSFLLNSLPIKENKDTLIIDKVIAEIDKKEGLISVLDILKLVPFGQKTLETKFKKMVGLTPGKYIQIKRFLNLMRKYEKHQINLKDLIFMYDYYDESHFSKDFKLFTTKPFKSYFKEDYLLIKKALKK
jgi:AraC-like DNA-binding protein